jgi:hypothetical protein
MNNFYNKLCIFNYSTLERFSPGMYTNVSIEFALLVSYSRSE